MSSADEQHECPQLDQAAAYVLGALHAEEADRYERHIHACSACGREVGRLQPSTDLLAQAAPSVHAPEGLKERVMAQVRAEAELLRAAGPQADRPPRRRRTWRLAAASTAAALACGIGIGILVTGTQGQPHATVRAYVAPTAPTGRAVVIRSDDHGELIVSRMPPPPAGKIYEVWLARPQHAPQPTDALFSVNRAGSATVEVPGSLAGVHRIMVTAEPFGGSSHPTSTPIIIATL